MPFTNLVQILLDYIFWPHKTFWLAAIMAICAADVIQPVVCKNCSKLHQRNKWNANQYMTQSNVNTRNLKQHKLNLVTEHIAFPLLSLSTIIRFFDSCSWIRITFSVPLTTKYPPRSIGHSLARANSAAFLPVKWHLELRNITGILHVQLQRITLRIQ